MPTSTTSVRVRGILPALFAALVLGALAPGALAQATYTVTVASKTASHPTFGQGFPEAYRINGAEAPAITLQRGKTYTFQMGGVPAFHPFYLSTSASGSGAGVYSDGVTGNYATGTGTLTFTVPASAPDVLWYQCSNHDLMGARMNVVNAAVAVPYAAVLSGANEVPANTSTASGTVTATLDGTTLVVGGSFAGLSAAYTVSHLHLGLAGQSGAVLIPLAPTVAADGRSGTFGAAGNTFTLTAEQVAALQQRRLYANVHSTANPAGEVRAQLVPAAAAQFRALVRAAEEVPANGSTAAGSFALELDGTTLTVSGSFAGLSAAYAASHLHIGFTGQNGGVVFGLTPTLATDMRSATYEAAANTFTLTAAQVEAFGARRFYVNVHSSARPGGEIRGQVTPASSYALHAALTGRAEMPANPSQATGGVVVEVRGLQVVASGSFAGFGSNFNTNVGGHLHLGALGANGPVVFPLAVVLGADSRSGTIDAAANTFAVTAEQAAAFVAGGYYANFHSVDRPGGEIRGQAIPIAQRTLEAWLVGMNEVGPVATTATGGAIGVLEGLSLTVAGGFTGLTSNFNTNVGAHLHAGAAGANGPVVFPLAVVLAADSRSGTFAGAANTFTLTAAQAASFAAGGFYANVHSVDRPSGEVRGQLLAAPNLAPAAPAITAPADGATVMISGARTTPFVVTWSATDPNANPLAHAWQLARDAAFTDVVFEAATGAAPRFETRYGAIDTLLASLGVATGGSAALFHRARTRDGSFGAASPATAITLQRGTVVANEREDGVAGRFAARRTVPNPFAGTTTLTLDLPEAAAVTVEVFDVLGRRVLRVDAGGLPAGSNQAVRIDGASLPVGTYVYRVRASGAGGERTATGRMVRAD